MIGQDEVKVRAAIGQSLPRVRGDRERLRQVLANLIDNATKYSSAGETVDVNAEAVNGRVLVTVRDTGPGIAREEQRLIFEKFGRARGGNARPGTGLGPLHRAVDCRSARRHARGPLRSRAGLDVLVVAAAGRCRTELSARWCGRGGG